MFLFTQYRVYFSEFMFLRDLIIKVISDTILHKSNCNKRWGIIRLNVSCVV